MAGSGRAPGLDAWGATVIRGGAKAVAPQGLAPEPFAGASFFFA